MIKSIALTFTLVLGLAACSKDKADELASERAPNKGEMCKCTDAACADKVAEKMDKLENKFEASFKSEKDVPKATMEKIEKLDDEYRDCRNKARGETE